MRCFGLTRRQLLDRLAGPNTLLNLSYSVHPPFLLEFERRIFCDLDPSEIFYWMTKMEMGQSHHHEFWTIGLNVQDDRLPLAAIAAEVANILSAGRYELLFGRAGAANGEVHHHRTMVLERGSGSGWRIS